MVINFLKKNHSKSLDKKINKIGSKKIFEQQRDLKNDIDEVNKFSREDIAAAAQKHLEWCLCEILNYYCKKLCN